jgi:hypothetical protein
MTNSRDWERGGPKLDCRGVETTHHCNRKDKKRLLWLRCLPAL